MESKKVKVLFMRHGYSISNYHQASRPKEKYKWDPELIDCTLHPRGEEECKAATKIINAQIKLKYVIVSPLIRARQTAILVTSTYPTMLKFYVHPLLREMVYQSNDIPSEFRMLPSEACSLKYFPESDDKYYYIRGLKYESELLKKYSSCSMKEFEKRIAAKMSMLSPVYLESKEDFSGRVEGFIGFLNDFIKSHNAVDGELLVITHSQFIHAVRRIFHIKSGHVKNCSITELDVQINK